MNVRDLIGILTKADPDATVEVATCPRPDEWYEIVDVEVGTPNVRGESVVVINTD